MKLKKILEAVDFHLEKPELLKLKKKVNDFLDLVDKNVAREKINAEVFLGGSFAKGTLTKAEHYDADIFVRFDWKYENLSDLLEKILVDVSKEIGLRLERLHGSRDYFRIKLNEKLTFEIIPVLKIKKVQEARNVTDLSYFHVNYVKRKLKENMKKEVALAKRFFKAAGIYGAESYIHGFSGYGIECLIIYYKSFEKMLKELSKIKNERKIIDIEKYYKKKDEVFFELNESKIQGPIVLIDPTWKERNVLASLSWETFRKFQERAREFLQKPSGNYFYESEISEDKLKNLAKQKKAEFLHVVLETDRQEGDIAGAKLKKFADFLAVELKKYFEIFEREFSYNGEGKKAELYLIVKKKKEVFRVGPPVAMEKNARKFRARNKKIFVKGGNLYARVKIDFSTQDFVKKFDRRKMREMGITQLKIL